MLILSTSSPSWPILLYSNWSLTHSRKDCLLSNTIKSSCFSPEASSSPQPSVLSLAKAAIPYAKRGNYPGSARNWAINWSTEKIRLSYRSKRSTKETRSSYLMTCWQLEVLWGLRSIWSKSWEERWSACCYWAELSKLVVLRSWTCLRKKYSGSMMIEPYYQNLLFHMPPSNFLIKPTIGILDQFIYLLLCSYCIYRKKNSWRLWNITAALYIHLKASQYNILHYNILYNING